MLSIFEYFLRLFIIIFTVFNISFLPQTCLDHRFQHLDNLRMKIVLCLLAWMHLLQLVLWMNPGQCENCFNEEYLTEFTISVYEILLIDFNGIISSQTLRKRTLKFVIKIINWTSIKIAKMFKKSHI